MVEWNDAKHKHVPAAQVQYRTHARTHVYSNNNGQTEEEKGGVRTGREGRLMRRFLTQSKLSVVEPN
jgi:hypothetical protein